MTDTVAPDPGSHNEARRKPISRRLRFEVLRRDNHTCRYCGATAPEAKITVDHVVPVALGGTDTADNLVAACTDCNAGKGSSQPDASLVADVAQDALRWEAVTRAATEHLQSQREARAKFVSAAFAIWNEWCGYRWNEPRDAAATFERWHDRGVTIQDVEYAATVTSESFGVLYHWAYFCGVVHKHLRQRDELARQMLDAERTEG